MTEKRLILNSQKTIVFELLKLWKLDATDFAWDETPSTVRPETTVSRVQHQASGFYFIFDHGHDSPYGSHYYERSPGTTSIKDNGYPGGWNLMETAFREWISYLTREIDSPDPWMGLSNHNQLGQMFTEISDNNPLTEEERQKVSDAIHSLRRYLEELEDLDEKRWSQVDEKLDLIIAASTTVGRKEWILLALGGLVSVFTSGMFAPEQSATYFQHATDLIKSAFSQMKLISGD